MFKVRGDFLKLFIHFQSRNIVLVSLIIDFLDREENISTLQEPLGDLVFQMKK